MKKSERAGDINRVVIICALFAAAVATLFAPESTCWASPSISADQVSLNFGVATKNDLDTGYIDPSPSPLDYMLRLNVSDAVVENWIVGVRAESPSFYSNGGQKPCGDLKWRINGSAAWTDIAPFTADIYHGSGDASIDLDFLMLTDWLDEPDLNYGIALIFTIVQEN